MGGEHFFGYFQPNLLLPIATKSVFLSGRIQSWLLIRQSGSGARAARQSACATKLKAHSLTQTEAVVLTF